MAGPVNMYFDVWDKDDYTGTSLGELTTAYAKKIYDPISGVGSGQFTMNKHSDEFTMARRDNLIRVRFGAGGPFAWDDSRYKFAFRIEQADDIIISADEAGGDEITRGGRSVISILERLIWWDFSFAAGDGVLEDGRVWQWTDNTFGKILQRMVNEWNARPAPGAIPATISKDFDETDDSGGVAWETFDGTHEIEIGTTYLQSVLDLADQGLEITMKPDFTLRAWAAETRGSDLSATICFRQGWNIRDSANHKFLLSHRGTRALVRGMSPKNGEVVYVEATYAATDDDENGTGAAADGRDDRAWGRREIFVANDNTTSTAPLMRAGREALRRNRLAEEGVPTIPVTSYADSRLSDQSDGGTPPATKDLHPYSSYNLGDTVTLDVTGYWNDGPHRISGITVDEPEDGTGESEVLLNIGTNPGSVDGPSAFGGSGGCKCPPGLQLCAAAEPLAGPDSVRGWIAGEGGADGDASAIMDGDLLSGDGTGYFIAKQRGNGGAVWMYWDTPVELTGYTMHQGFSPEDAQYANTGQVQAGWRVFVNDNDDAAMEPATFPGSWVEIENAESSASAADSTHSISAGGVHHWYLWRSSVQDTPGALQIDWLIREIEIDGGSNPNNGTDTGAARCDHTHDHNDLTGRSATDDHPASSISEAADGDVQTAIDNLRGATTPAAADVTYDPSTSGLTATDVQGAIDEVEDRVDTLEAATPLTNPMTTEDDLIVGGTSGTPTRLAKGTDGQRLTVDPTTHHLVWADPSEIAEILDIPTAETDTSLVLAPDGAGGVEFRAESGGGGGGSGSSPFTLNDATLYPLDGTYGDDFDGASLNGRWSRLNIDAGTEDFAVGDTWMRSLRGGTVASGGEGYYQTPASMPTYAELVFAGSFIGDTATGGSPVAGLFFATSAGAGMGCWINTTSNIFRLQGLSSGAPSGSNADIGINSPAGTIHWLRLIRVVGVSTVFFGQLSLDGNTWSNQTFLVDTTAVTRIGFGRFVGNASLMSTLSIDRFNVIAKTLGNNLCVTPTSGTFTPTASSSFSGFSPASAFDGNMATDWASNGYSAGQYIQGVWSVAQTVNTVILTGRTSDVWANGYVEFSSGKRIPTGYMTDNRQNRVVLRFPDESTTLIKVVSTSGGATNPGFREIEAYNAT